MKHVFYIILTVKTAADVGPTSPRRRPDVGWTSAIDLGPTSARRRLDLGWTSEHAGISDIQPTSCRGWTDVGPTSACRCRVADVTPTSADVGPTSACLLGSDSFVTCYEGTKVHMVAKFEFSSKNWSRNM